MKEKLFARLASLVLAVENCKEKGNAEWEAKHTEKAESLVKQYLPHGSGYHCASIETD